MASVNKAIVVGYLGADPETKTIKNGDLVANFRVATNQQWTDPNGEQHERTEWHNMTAWRRTAEIVRDYLRKGSQVYIEGELRTDAWDGECNKKHYKTSIVVSVLQMLGRAQDAEAAAASPSVIEASPAPADEAPAELAGVRSDDGGPAPDPDAKTSKRRRTPAA